MFLKGRAVIRSLLMGSKLDLEKKQRAFGTDPKGVLKWTASGVENCQSAVGKLIRKQHSSSVLDHRVRHSHIIRVSSPLTPR